MNPYLTVELVTVILLTTLAKLLNCQRREDSSLTCTTAEIQRAGCIHGKCYIVVLNGEREPSCVCESGYAGSKCQELNLDLIVLAKPNIYLIVGIIILVLIVAAIIFFICYRRMKGLPLSGVFSKEGERQLVPQNEERPELNHVSVSRNPGTLKVENGHTVER